MGPNAAEDTHTVEMEHHLENFLSNGLQLQLDYQDHSMQRSRQPPIVARTYVQWP